LWLSPSFISSAYFLTHHPLINSAVGYGSSNQVDQHITQSSLLLLFLVLYETELFISKSQLLAIT
ncbi:hypothetical protein, partial [Pseudoalteromonas sp.]|uniref:hypothetical protein n=1 Tax=Pseudoalteromonas sp. TaxID=53249 RepID=UPI003F97A54A